MTAVKLPPLDAHDHPDNRVMHWSKCELRAIRAYATATAEAHAAALAERVRVLEVALQAINEAMYVDDNTGHWMFINSFDPDTTIDAALKGTPTHAFSAFAIAAERTQK